MLKKNQPEEEAAPAEMQAFDKRLMPKKEKKAGGFGQRKPAATKEEPQEAAPAGTFFKAPKVEKKSSFGKRSFGKK